MRTCLGFPMRVLATCFAFPPPLSFFLYFFLIQFYSRVCFFSELSFFVLHFLVSPPCSYFFFGSSMVDYSAIRVDCSLVAFFFAHLGCLLESVEGECLERVSFFVGQNCPYISVLSSLFPLVSRSAEVAGLLMMSKVRCSDLEMGLSFFDDHLISEATFVSSSYKAWTISCSLTGKDE